MPRALLSLGAGAVLRIYLQTWKILERVSFRVPFQPLLMALDGHQPYLLCLR